jgi:hypothetical protein
MKLFGGQASWAKIMSPGGKLTVLACHPTKKVNKAEYLTYLSTTIGATYVVTKLSIQDNSGLIMSCTSKCYLTSSKIVSLELEI